MLAATIGWHLTAGHFADRNDLALSVVQAALRGQTSLILIAIGAIAAGLGVLRTEQGQPHRRLHTVRHQRRPAVLSLLIALFSGFVVVSNWPQDSSLSAFVLLGVAGAGHSRPAFRPPRSYCRLGIRVLAKPSCNRSR